MLQLLYMVVNANSALRQKRPSCSVLRVFKKGTKIKIREGNKIPLLIFEGKCIFEEVN